jgi:hypothetical protein
LIGASSDSSPRSTALRTASALTGLLIEAAWNSVVSVTGVFAATSASPNPRAQSRRPWSNTAMLTPCTL